MNAETGTVDHDDVAVEGLCDLTDDMIPNPRFSPSHETLVARGVRPILLRYVRRRRACAEPPQDAVDHPRVIDPRRAATLVRE